MSRDVGPETQRLAEEERQLQEAIALSMQDQAPPPCDEDEEMRQALALSMQQTIPSAQNHSTSPPAMPPAINFSDADSGGPSLARLIFGDRPSPAAIWRTQVFRAILERRRVLESERGSAGVTRETRKRKDVVGVRLEPQT